MDKRVNTSEIIDRVQSEVKRWIRGFSDMDLVAFARGQWIPQIDLYAEAERIVVLADLPGLAPGDVELSLRGEVLTIAGEKPGGETREKPLVGERRSGTFSRSVTLPYSVDQKEVSATLTNGVLEIALKRAEPEDKGGIKIDVS